ncbi:MAG: cysteate racemase [Symbiobacteriia bacterium]
MTDRQDKVIGILGGMGPEATVDLFGKIVRATPVATEHDHLRIIVDDNPKIPSRLDFIPHGGPSPVPAMQDMARGLERAGADLIVIGANTAHYFYADIQAAVQVPIIHMIEETARETAERWPAVKTIGLLATTSTVKTRMYHEAFAPFGVTVIAPAVDEQDQVMAAIHAFKEGDNVAQSRGTLLTAAEGLVERGAQAVLMGCTEVPVILSGIEMAVPLIDANQLIAEVIVRRAKE